QRFRGGPHGERLLERAAARLGHHGDLGREPLDELALLREHRRGHEQREVDVLVAGGLDAVVELALDRLPDRVAVRLDDHRAAPALPSTRGNRPTARANGTRSSTNSFVDVYRPGDGAPGQRAGAPTPGRARTEDV